MGQGEFVERTATRETLDAGLRYVTFDALMDRVSRGELSFEDAVAEYRLRELSQALPAVAGAAAVQGS